MATIRLPKPNSCLKYSVIIVILIASTNYGGGLTMIVNFYQYKELSNVKLSAIKNIGNRLKSCL